MSLRNLGLIGILILATIQTGCVSLQNRENQVSRSAFPEELLVEVDRQPDLEIPLWPEGAPGSNEATDALSQHYVERENQYNLPDRAALEVTDPTIKLFQAENPNGSVLLIIPGGGYNHVVVEKEGYEGARLFNKLGVTVYVMTYRLPHQGWGDGPDTPLQDAQRAVRLIRSRALVDDIDPERIAVMGFSAGGHVAGSLLTRYNADVYDGIDAIDDLSAKPDLGALIYPVISMDKAITHTGSREKLIGESPNLEQVQKYSVELNLEDLPPPTFIMHAADDRAVPVENSLRMYSALLKNGVQSELHVFSTGGHGFGVRGLKDKPQAAWPELFFNFGLHVGTFEK